jgi:hypothetical protein
MTTNPASLAEKVRLLALRKAKRAARKATLQQTETGWNAPPPRFVTPDRSCVSCGGLVDESTLSIVENVARIRRSCMSCGKITIALAEAGA